LPEPPARKKKGNIVSDGLPNNQEGKTLYWVKFIDQSNGMNIDTYFIAHNLQHLEDNIADILEVKAIKDVQDLTS
jgi:hypothetical protein